MIFESTTSSVRRSLVDEEETNILLNLAKHSSANVKLNALDTLSHLPLPERVWAQLGKLIQEELLQAKSLEDKAALLAVGTWVPYGFDPEKEARKTEQDSLELNRLLELVKRIQHQYRIRQDRDLDWEASQAQGFVLFSESELLAQKSQLESQVPVVASKLLDWKFYDSTHDFVIADPVLISLLFELSAKDDYYDVQLINNLLKSLERIENFKPDLRGLFEEYLRCVNGWIRDRSSNYGERNARWFQMYRDDEDPYSWRSWQIAWTVSRGGLKGLISSLTIPLTAHDDEAHQIAALALIADAADYVLQRSAAVFGGGIRPPRSAAQIDARVSVSHPQRLAKGFSSQILVNLYLPQFRAAVLKKVRDGFEDDPIEHRFGASLPQEGDVLIGFSSADITISEPVVTTILEGNVSTAFTAKPNNECRHGKHYVKFFIKDPDTKREFLSTTIPLVVTDFAVDHLSQPFVSKLSATCLALGSIIMFALTLFQQIDKTLGVTSGAALFVIASAILARFKYVFGRSVNQEENLVL